MLMDRQCHNPYRCVQGGVTSVSHAFPIEKKKKNKKKKQKKKTDRPDMTEILLKGT